MTAPGGSAATSGDAATQGAATFGDPARVDAAHRAIRGDASIQFDLPWRVAENNPPPRWLTEIWDLLGRFVEWVGPTGWKALMWLAVAAIAVALLLALFPTVREWLAARFSRRTETRSAAPDWTPGADRARALLDEADHLAAQGRYAEAVRLILHRSIEDIETWRGDPLRPSLTSRDIARFDALPDAARTVFRRIVADVERSLFGGRPLDQADWTRARADYAGFALGPMARA